MPVRNAKSVEVPAHLVDETLRDAPPLSADQIAALRLIIHGLAIGKKP